MTTPYTPLISWLVYYAPKVAPFTAIRDDVMGCVHGGCLMAHEHPDVVFRHLLVDHGAGPVDVFAAAFSAVRDTWEADLMAAVDDDEPARSAGNGDTDEAAP